MRRILAFASIVVGLSLSACGSDATGPSQKPSYEHIHCNQGFTESQDTMGIWHCVPIG